MSQTVSHTTSVEAIDTSVLPRRPSAAKALLEVTKPGITRLVTITSAVGFGLAAAHSLIGPARLLPAIEWPQIAIALAATLTGTALSSSGVNTLNQWWERDRDRLMNRTARRPLPRGDLAPSTALLAGIALSVLGIATLWLGCGPVPAAIALVTILSYLLVYTPLKPVTPWSTPVGAIPGALPPLIGWSAAYSLHGPATAFESLTHPIAILLFAIMFVWQVPHTLAIAWMYKDDYAKAGHRLLPVIDGDGSRTARWMAAWSFLLIPVSIAPAIWMQRGPAWAFAVVAALMGVGYFVLALKVIRTRQRTDARRVFFASIIHLPLLLIGLVLFVLVSRLG